MILDNGRTALLGTDHEEMLGCLRCGACLNACPVYRQTGGHAYGWVYPGPMGAVLTPLLVGRDAFTAPAVGGDRPGRPGRRGGRPARGLHPRGVCMDACPVEIPLQDLLLPPPPGASRAPIVPLGTGGLGGRSRAWSRPSTYRATLRTARWGERMLGLIGWPTRRGPGLGMAEHSPTSPPAASAPGWALVLDRSGTASPLPALACALESPAGDRPPLDVPDGVAGAQVSAHPRPAPTSEVPVLRYATVDPTDLLGSFARAATDAGARVHLVDGSEVPDDLVERLVAEHGIAQVAATAEGRSDRLPMRSPAGCVVGTGPAVTRAQRAAADLGITSASALVAATMGSVVVDVASTGDRTTSLLPAVHLVAAAPSGSWMPPSGSAPPRPAGTRGGRADPVEPGRHHRPQPDRRHRAAAHRGGPRWAPRRRDRRLDLTARPTALSRSGRRGGW